MLGYCGLDCQKCGAFIATQTNDDALRAKVAEEWTQLYKVPVKPEDINCTGCRSAGVKAWYSGNLCEIRKCGMRRSVCTCAPCPEFPCPRIEEFHRAVPEAKKNLESLREK